MFGAINLIVDPDTSISVLRASTLSPSLCKRAVPFFNRRLMADILDD